MAKALESDSNKKSGLPTEKIDSQRPDVSRNGGATFIRSRAVQQMTNRCRNS